MKRGKNTTRIIIIERDPSVQMLLKHLYQKKSHFCEEQEILTASSVKEAEEMIESICCPRKVVSIAIIVSENLSPEKRKELSDFTMRIPLPIPVIEIDTTRELALH